MALSIASCCGTAGATSVGDFLERGLRRRRAAALPLASRCERPDGLYAAFGLALRDGTVVGASFAAASCATLIAACEALAELSCGRRADEAARLGPGDILNVMHGVPAMKRDRLGLAVAAFRLALTSPPGERSSP